MWFCFLKLQLLPSKHVKSALSIDFYDRRIAYFARQQFSGIIIFTGVHTLEGEFRKLISRTRANLWRMVVLAGGYGCINHATAFTRQQRMSETAHLRMRILQIRQMDVAMRMRLWHACIQVL